MDNEILSKTPPHNYEAEIACLGAILLKNKVYEDVFEKLTHIDFYDRRNQIIAEAIFSIKNKDRNNPIDIITLSNHLKDSNTIVEAGGVDYISSLVDLVPATANAGYYANIIKENSIKRKLIDGANEIISFTQNSDKEIAEIIENSSQIIHEISKKLYSRDFIHIKDILYENLKKMKEDFQIENKSKKGEKKKKENSK